MIACLFCLVNWLWILVVFNCLWESGLVLICLVSFGLYADMACLRCLIVSMV